MAAPCIKVMPRPDGKTTEVLYVANGKVTCLARETEVDDIVAQLRKDFPHLRVDYRTPRTTS
jgi:hypothetical protein